jgi:phage N-6-adenine-methyltransferase
VGENRAARTDDKRREDWETPPDIFHACDLAAGGFVRDAAANYDNRKLEAFWGEKDDALGIYWSLCHGPLSDDPGPIWLNWPYSRKGNHAWPKKCLEESRQGCTIWALAPAATDTDWWRLYCNKAAEIRFIPYRIPFLKDGIPCRENIGASAVVIWRPDPPPMPFMWMWDPRGKKT